MKDYSWQSRKIKLSGQSRVLKLPIIPKKKQRHQSSSKNLIAFQSIEDSFPKLQPIRHQNNSAKNKSMDQSVESVKSQQKLKIRQSLPKNSSAMNKKKGSLHRIYTQQNSQVKDFSLPKSPHNDKTLQNFKKHVKMNREFIHKEITKRTASEKKEQSHQKKKQKNSQYLQHNNNNRYSNNGLFEKLKKVLKKQFAEQETNQMKSNLDKVKQSAKLMKILQKLKKMHPEKSLYQIKKENMETNTRSEIKNENNYHEWRRLQINNPVPHYEQSCFEVENQRLITITSKNEQKMKEYIESQEQLLKLKSLKVKTSIC